MFYFHIANRYPNGNQALRCRSCSNLKHVHKLPFKVPYIFVHNGRVVGKDPDNPGTEHFCQPEFPNYPVIKKRTRKSTQETPKTSTEQLEPDTSIDNTNTPENLTTQFDEYDEEINQELLTSIDCTPQNSLNETSLKYEDPDT
uniref:Uncharacterized protein n=1 Tax=Acrobeloides nanus TaxID=290746 RepID=A0A914DGQ2_9BILA